MKNNLKDFSDFWEFICEYSVSLAKLSEKIETILIQLGRGQFIDKDAVHIPKLNFNCVDESYGELYFELFDVHVLPLRREYVFKYGDSLNLREIIFKSANINRDNIINCGRLVGRRFVKIKTNFVNKIY